MTWWQNILQYGCGSVLSALIAAGALLIQQKLTNKRERDRRQSESSERVLDRAHEVEQTNSERASALQERWRDERQQSHAALLHSLNEAAALVFVVLNDLMAYRPFATTDAEVEQTDRDLHRLQVATREVSARAAAMELIGSSASARQATLAVNLTTALTGRLSLNFRRQRAGGDAIDEETLATRYDQQIAAIAAYLAAARHDLGVD